MSTVIPSEIVAATEAVLKNADRPVMLHEPLLEGNAKKYVTSCIDENWVSSVGAFVDRFEQDLAKACGAKYAIAMTNGTSALSASLIMMGVQPDDEVLIPSLTFVATANAVSHANAVPHFVEVEEQSLGIDPVALDQYLRETVTSKNGLSVNKHTGRVIRALMPVHVFGHPCQLAALKAIAEKYNLLLLEDATEALGSRIGEQRIGSDGVAVFSFNGNKIITTGGGGAITLQDEETYKRFKHTISTGKLPHAWRFDHDVVAWNYRMPNLNAALGCAQLEGLEKFIAAKRNLAERYAKAFLDVKGARILQEPEGTTSNYWLVALMVDDGDEVWLEDTLTAFHNAQILCRPLWTPLHQLPMYSASPRSDLRLTESLVQRVISLPSSVKLNAA